MDEFKTQPAVVAEIAVTLPDGQSFVAANLTVQFVSTMNGAYARAMQIIDEVRNGAKTEHAMLIQLSVMAIETTVAVGCKTRATVSAFPVRIQQAPPAKPKSGWGS